MVTMFHNADASPYVVFTNADSGAGTLRQAILDANTAGGTSTITFTNAVTDPIVLASPLQALLYDTTIDGTGAAGASATIDGGNLYRLFVIGAFTDPVEVTLKNLILQNGRAKGGNGGGGGMGAGGALFINDVATVTLQNVALLNNRAIGGNSGNGYGSGGGMGGNGQAHSGSGKGGGGFYTSTGNAGGGGAPGIFGVGIGINGFNAGQGGFGGGAGYDYGGGGGHSNAGKGGIGGGNASTGALGGSGGGGAGFGGSIFIRKSSGAAGQLIIQEGVTESGSGTTGGTGNAGVGAHTGDAIFLMSGTTLIFFPTVGETTTITSSIADDSLNSLPSGNSYKPGNGTGANVTMSGLGEVILEGDNTYAGTTTVDSGTLTFKGNANALGGNISVASGATLAFNQSAPSTLSRLISGAGSVTQKGSSTLTFSAANT